jgi:hypothetical protein
MKGFARRSVAKTGESSGHVASFTLLNYRLFLFTDWSAVCFSRETNFITGTEIKALSFFHSSAVWKWPRFGGAFFISRQRLIAKSIILHF